jgi:hypothetical protein
MLEPRAPLGAGEVQDFFVPPMTFDDELPDLPGRMSVTFSGSALLELAHGASLLGMSLGDFVRIAVKQRTYLAEMQRQGKRIVLRDEFGSDYELPAAVSF